MKISRSSIVICVVTVAILLIGIGRTGAFGARKQAFGFNAALLSGFPDANGSIRAANLTGGGVYDLPSFVNSSGGFGCLSDITGAQFSSCLTGQGVRWDTSALLPSTTFKCTGAATETLKTATTGNHTAVLLADFYRAGDGIDESFTAKMFVSDTDQAPDIPGVQNIWIQGIGCGTATVSFN